MISMVLRISHLIFVNDVLLFIKGTLEEWYIGYTGFFCQCFKYGIYQYQVNVSRIWNGGKPSGKNQKYISFSSL